jgi:hypothetical protein
MFQVCFPYVALEFLEKFGIFWLFFRLFWNCLAFLEIFGHFGIFWIFWKILDF